MSNERRYYDALKRITQYSSPETIKRTAERQYGLSPEEALEYAYENVVGEAQMAIKGKRRPAEEKAKSPTED